jgi:hypothetical protein
MKIVESPLQVVITKKLDEIFAKPESDITKADLLLLSHLTDASVLIDLDVIEEAGKWLR